MFFQITLRQRFKLCKKFKIKKKVLNFKNKNCIENNLLSILKKNNIKLICLAGFMKILSKNFIKKFDGRILNIHPSFYLNTRD